MIYPGGMPGFDPSHPAAKGMVRPSGACGFSCAFINKNLSCQGLARPGNNLTLGQGASAIWDGHIGPAGNASGTGGPEWDIAPTGVPAQVTMGVIALGGNGTMITWGKGFSQNVLEIYSASGAPTLAYGNNASGITGLGAPPMTMVAGHPYFVGCSYVSSAGPCNYAITDLMTGRIAIASIANTATPASISSNAFGILDDSVNGNRYNNYVAMGMINPNYAAPMPVLYAWAQKPFDFWYPPMLRDTLLILSSKASPLAKHAMQRAHVLA